MQAILKIKNIIFMLVLLAVFASCSTDLPINASWKDITLVYFILNQNDSVHYAKINKVFLGDENAYIMAKIPDSSNYKNINVQLIPFTLNGDTTWDTPVQMLPTYEVPKDTVRLSGEPAIFSSDSNLLYKTTAVLKADKLYKLLINIPAKHKTVSSTTDLINGLDVSKPSTVPEQKIGFYDGTNFTDYKTQWKAVGNASLYGVSLRFHYTEKYSNGTSTDKFIDWVRPNIEYVDPEGLDNIVAVFPGDEFYSYINSMIQDGNDPGIKRICNSVDFIFVVAGDALSTYIDVNGPSNSVVQEHPNFTNINDGIGIFSSRYNKTIAGKQLTDLSLDELSKGTYTKHLRFEDHNGHINP
ncbi:MAG: hypothetical protein NTW49_04260 [Bacteroidia bacterium]|nr:hypothetical protein [Bacteroidia bacterium]